MARIRKRLAEEMRRLRGTNARAVIARMNPTIRGWSAYYRGTVSSKVFSSLDNYMWQLTVGWARRTHPKKPKKWTARRHWGPVQQVQERSVGVRRRKVKPALDSYNLRLLAKQDGRCPLCGDHLLTADQPPQSPSEWERWWLGVVKRAIAADYLTHHGRAARLDETHLVHALLSSQPPGSTTQESNGFRSSRNVLGACLNRMPGRLARTVPRGTAAAMRRSYPTSREDAPSRDPQVLIIAQHCCVASADQLELEARDRVTADCRRVASHCGERRVVDVSGQSAVPRS